MLFDDRPAVLLLTTVQQTREHGTVECDASLVQRVDDVFDLMLMSIGDHQQIGGWIVCRDSDR